MIAPQFDKSEAKKSYQATFSRKYVVYLSTFLFVYEVLKKSATFTCTRAKRVDKITVVFFWLYNQSLGPWELNKESNRHVSFFFYYSRLLTLTCLNMGLNSFTFNEAYTFTLMNFFSLTIEPLKIIVRSLGETLIFFFF